MTTPTRPFFADQVSFEIEEMGRVEPVRWIRVSVPILDAASVATLKRLETFAQSTDQLLRVFEPVDQSATTWVFKDSAITYVLAMFGIAQTKGTAAWRIETGETPR